MKNSINSTANQLILLVYVPENEAKKFTNQLETKMDETFNQIQLITIVTILITCLVAILSGCIYSNKIV